MFKIIIVYALISAGVYLGARYGNPTDLSHAVDVETNREDAIAKAVAWPYHLGRLLARDPDVVGG